MIKGNLIFNPSHFITLQILYSYSGTSLNRHSKKQTTEGGTEDNGCLNPNLLHKFNSNQLKNDTKHGSSYLEEPAACYSIPKNHKYWTALRHYDASYRSSTNNKLTLFQKVFMSSDDNQSIEPCPIAQFGVAPFCLDFYFSLFFYFLNFISL